MLSASAHSQTKGFPLSKGLPCSFSRPHREPNATAKLGSSDVCRPDPGDIVIAAGEPNTLHRFRYPSAQAACPRTEIAGQCAPATATQLLQDRRRIIGGYPSKRKSTMRSGKSSVGSRRRQRPRQYAQRGSAAGPRASAFRIPRPRSAASSRSCIAPALRAQFAQEPMGRLIQRRPRPEWGLARRWNSGPSIYAGVSMNRANRPSRRFGKGVA